MSFWERKRREAAAKLFSAMEFTLCTCTAMKSFPFWRISSRFKIVLYLLESVVTDAFDSSNEQKSSGA